MARVTIEPLAIGSVDGPRVYIAVRRVLRHLDIEEIAAADELAARRWAATRWHVRLQDVAVQPVQVILLESDAP